MATQQKTKDIIYSWVDESGQTHYENYKVPVEQESHVKNTPPPMSNPIGILKTAKVATPKVETPHENPFSKTIQNTANGTLTIAILFILLILFKGLLNKETFLQLFFKKLRKSLKEEGKTRKTNHEPKVDIEENEKSYPENISISEKIIKDEPQATLPTPSWTIEFLRSLEWQEFEKLCARILQERGFQAEMGKGGPDGGIDIRIYAKNEPEKLYGIAQCKAQRQEIKIDTVKAFRWTMEEKQVEKGFFFTSGEFSKPARQFGEEKKIEMETGKKLLESILELPEGKQSAILAEIIETDYTTPTCAKCGIKMARKANKKTGEEFWGCKNYPECNNTLDLRWIDHKKEPI